MMFSTALVVASLLGTPAQAAACSGSPADWIEAVRTKGKRDAYLCLAETETAGAALLEVIGHEGFAELDGKERVTRALAVHLLHRLDRLLTGSEVRALAPSDRRLLRDGVYARRGRPTPSPEHEAVFAQFDWYSPSAEFNNGRLQAPDRDNLALIDKPPAAPKADPAPSAAEAMAETNTPRPPPPPGSPPPPEGAPPPDDLPPGPATGPQGAGPQGPGPQGAGPQGVGPQGPGPQDPAAEGSTGGLGCSHSGPVGSFALVGLPLCLGLVRRQD